MELILISESKLKIMLSAVDMQLYELDTENLDYDNTETRKAFWNILDEAKHRTGFDAASDRVFVQVYPSREGGCEMYITKLQKNDDVDESNYEILNKYGSCAKDQSCSKDQACAKEHLNSFEKESPKEQLSDKACIQRLRKGGLRVSNKYSTRVYKFDNIQNLINVCAKLTDNDIVDQSHAFCDSSTNEYYLVIDLNLEMLSTREIYTALSFVGEYASSDNSQSAHLYIKEHCSLICHGNAVDTLAVL